MRSFQYVIQDELGIHARPAGMLAKEAKKYPCAITLEKDGKKVDVTRLMALMSLGVRKGSEVLVTAEGEQEDQAIEAIEALVKENL